MCQYRRDAERTDGRCEWHGQVEDYRRTSDRRVLFNHGLCGEDDKGPRFGQLCTPSEHHLECAEGEKERERRERAKTPTLPSRHEIALGGAHHAA